MATLALNVASGVVDELTRPTDMDAENRKKRLNLSKEAFVAQSNANLAACAVGAAAPYADLVEIGDGLPLCN